MVFIARLCLAIMKKKDIEIPETTDFSPKAFKMPRSSFYYKEIKRNYHEAKEAILSLYKKNKNRDGYRPMTLKLHQMGFNLNHKTVLRLMNELGIHSILRKKRHGKRGKTSHIAPNLLNRDFTATALNQKWVTDVTEFQVGQEKLYFQR